MDRIILPGYRSHVPEVPAGLTKPMWHLPLHIRTNNGIDLDYGPLLLFDRIVIDSFTIQHLEDTDRPYLDPLRQSIQTLRSAGYVEVVDFSQALALSRDVLAEQLSFAMQDPLQWTSPILKSIDEYRSKLPEFSDLLKGDYNDATANMGFGTFLYFMKRDIKEVREEEQRIHRLFRSKKKRWTNQEINLIREIVQPSVSWIYQNVALSEVVGAPVIDVDHTANLYSMVHRRTLRVLNPQLEDANARIHLAKNIFNVLIPHLRPSTPQQMLDLLADKRTKNFRSFVDEAVVEGRTISADDFNLVLTDIVKAEQAIQGYSSILKWTGRALSLIPGAGTAAIFVEEAVERLIRKRNGAKQNWMYALIEHSGSQPNQKCRS